MEEIGLTQEELEMNAKAAKKRWLIKEACYGVGIVLAVYFFFLM